MDEKGILAREVKVLVFDLYRTIVDTQKGLTDAATPFLKEKGVGGRASSLRHLVASSQC